MDTEAFLLARQELVSRMEARRLGSLQEKATHNRFLGVTWPFWASLLAGGMRTGFAGRWLVRLLVPTLLPAAMAYVQKKSTAFSGQKSLWDRLTGVLSFLSTRRW